MLIIIGCLIFAVLVGMAVLTLELARRAATIQARVQTIQTVIQDLHHDLLKVEQPVFGKRTVPPSPGEGFGRKLSEP